MYQWLVPADKCDSCECIYVCMYSGASELNHRCSPGRSMINHPNFKHSPIFFFSLESTFRPFLYRCHDITYLYIYIYTIYLCVSVYILPSSARTSSMHICNEYRTATGVERCHGSLLNVCGGRRPFKFIVYPTVTLNYHLSIQRCF